MKNYEIFFIFDPSIDDTGINNTIEQIKKHIEELDGNVKDIKDNGIQTLSYEINKSKQGHNVIFNMEIDPLKLDDFKREIKLQSNIWRYFIKSLN